MRADARIRPLAPALTICTENPMHQAALGDSIALSADIVGMNPKIAGPSRRQILAAAVIAPAALAVPSLASSQSPFRLAEGRYHAAARRFNSLPPNLETDDERRFLDEEARYLRASRAVDSAYIADWQELADAFEHACDYGTSTPSEQIVMKLLNDARRLRRDHRLGFGGGGDGL